MRKFLLRAAPLAALAAMTAAAPLADAKSPVEPGGKPAHKQCFNNRFVQGFAAPDEHNLYVRVSPRDVYHFEMFGPCPDIDWNQRLGLVSRGSSWICDGLDAEVITHTQIGPQRCSVRNMTKLTSDEIKALPKRARP